MYVQVLCKRESETERRQCSNSVRFIKGEVYCMFQTIENEKINAKMVLPKYFTLQVDKWDKNGSKVK